MKKISMQLIKTLTIVFLVAFLFGCEKEEAYQDATDSIYFTYEIINDGTEVMIIDYDESGPLDVVIPEEIEELPVTVLGKFSFYNKGLTSILIPDSVITIEYGALNSNDITIVIPKGVISFDTRAFVNEFIIDKIEVDKDNDYYKSIDGILFSKDGETLIVFPMESSLQSYTIPDGVITIGEYAFYRTKLRYVTIASTVKIIEANAFGSNELNNIEIPDGVEYIGYSAFSGGELTSIIIPGSIIKIGEWAFSSNVLQNVTISEGVLMIENNAFSFNVIKSITIPASVSSIGVSAFNNNPNLSGYEVSADSSYYKSIDGVLYSKDGTTLVHMAQGDNRTSYTIPNGVTIINDYAFYGNTLTSVVIPDSVTTIGERAFGKNELESVVIPINLDSLGRYAFEYNNLTSVTIPEGLSIIESGVFIGNELTSVTIPDSITIIEDYAFSRNSLTSIIIPEGVIEIEFFAFNRNEFTSVTILGVQDRFDEYWTIIGFPE